jgi:hypothetical protein
MVKEASPAVLIYDGYCPFCSRYVRYLRLREAVGELRLVDAREGGPEVEAAKAEGLDLDEGMVLRLGDATYHGADCLNRLALMSSPSGVFNRLNAALFRSPRLSALGYPVLRCGRNLALRLLRRPRLAD